MKKEKTEDVTKTPGNELLKCYKSYCTVGDEIEELKEQISHHIKDFLDIYAPFEIEMEYTNWNNITLKIDSCNLHEYDLQAIKEYLGMDTYSISYENDWVCDKHRDVFIVSFKE